MEAKAQDCLLYTSLGRDIVELHVEERWGESVITQLRKGFKKVTVTPASGDYGADLIAYDKKGDCWVFQCKHFQNKVGNSAVQEVVAAKAHYHANKAGVMTNSKLTDKAKELALENDIFLYEMING